MANTNVEQIKFKVRKPWYMSINEFKNKFISENWDTLSNRNYHCDISNDVDCKYLIVNLMCLNPDCRSCQYIKYSGNPNLFGVGKCEHCGSNGVYLYDPYDWELRNQKNIVCLCEDCYRNLRENI